MFKVLSFLVSIVMLALPATAAETAPMSVSGAKTVSVEEAAALFDEGVAFVDVRKHSDFSAGRIPEAIHLDLADNYSEETLRDVVAQSDAVVIYCNGINCLRSSKACAMAVEWGYSNVYYLRDGFPAWESAGMPVE